MGRVQKDAYKKTRVRIYTEDYTPAKLPTLRRQDTIIYKWDIHIWTDGSAKDNGSDICTAGAAWTLDLLFSDKVMLTGAALSNNVAEVATMVLCLMAWRDAHIVIHTNSTYVMGLMEGGLLSMERDRWGEAPRQMSRGPPTPLLKYLLYLTRDRTGRISLVKVKAHGDDLNNNIADKLANKGWESGRMLDIGSLQTTDGWVDDAPVLCHQPLDYLTAQVVQNRFMVPAMTNKFGQFADRWVVTIGTLFDKVLDPGQHIGKIWRIAIPEGLREVLWKEMNGAQVLGERYFGTRYKKSDMGRVCLCRQTMSLAHILLGCPNYER